MAECIVEKELYDNTGSGLCFKRLSSPWSSSVTERYQRIKFNGNIDCIYMITFHRSSESTSKASSWGTSSMRTVTKISTSGWSSTYNPTWYKITDIKSGLVIKELGVKGYAWACVLLFASEEDYNKVSYSVVE